MTLHNPKTVTDRNLEAATTISLKREPACFAFLCTGSVMPPLLIDAINLDLASADYYAGRASIWATFEIRTSASPDRSIALLGFDEAFLRPFARALLQAATTRSAFRMNALGRGEGSRRDHVVEYVTGEGIAIRGLVITAYDQVVTIARVDADGGEETLFQLPRSDSFLRAFSRMASQADQVLQDTLADLARIARARPPGRS